MVDVPSLVCSPVFGVLADTVQDHFQVQWFARGIDRTQKSCSTYDYDLLQQKNQMKISRVKRHTGHSPGEVSYSPLPVEFHGPNFSRNNVVKPRIKYCQPEKLPQALVSRVFTGGQSRRHQTHAWLSLQAPTALSEVRQGRSMAQASGRHKQVMTGSHVAVKDLAWLRPGVCKGTLNLQDILCTWRSAGVVEGQAWSALQCVCWAYSANRLLHPLQSKKSQLC